MCKTTWTDEPGGTGDEYADIEQAEILNKRGHLKGDWPAWKRDILP